MADPTARGRFVWHELITPNGAGAHEFYAQVAGWRKQGWEHDASYSMFVAPSGPLGAAVEKPGVTSHWLPYVGVPEVDTAVVTALRLGAAVLTPPTSVPNAGRHAVLADPQGAVFAVHSSTMEPSPERPAAPGEFSWHELATTVDPSLAFPFYAELFGWDELARHDMGSMGTYLIFGRNGVQQGGIFNKREMGLPGPGYWVCYVRVSDLDDAIASAKAARGSVLQGPSDVPGGDRIVQLMDPHGAFFALHWSAGAPAAGVKAEPRARKPAETKAASKTSKKTSKKPAKKAKKAKKIGKKAAKKVAKKVAKKTTKKAAKKVTKKATKKTTKKAAKKPAKKAGKPRRRAVAKGRAKVARKKTAARRKHR
jgi:predicted enzyme related to lactoylglutathione lyase